MLSIIVDGRKSLFVCHYTVFLEGASYTGMKLPSSRVCMTDPLWTVVCDSSVLVSSLFDYDYVVSTYPELRSAFLCASKEL